MSILYYKTSLGIGGQGNFSYTDFGGAFKLVVPNNTFVNVNQLVYNDFITQLTPPFFNAWTYSIFWNANISQPLNSESKSSRVYPSNPPRYDFGHICTRDKVGVTWDSILKFVDQKTPNFRTYMQEGNANPGGSAVIFDPPLETNSVLGFNPPGNTGGGFATAEARANDLCIYLKFNPEVAVEINYYCTLSFDAFTIVALQQVVGIYP
jgi:hypothetical protein